MESFEPGWWDRGVLVCAAAAELGTLLGLVQVLISALPLSRVTAFFVAGWRAVTSWRRDTSSCELVDSMVAEQLMSLKVSQFRSAATVFSVLWSMGTLVIVLQIVQGDTRVQTATQDIVHLLIQGILTGVLLKPCLVTHRTLSWVYSALVLCMTVRIVPLVANEDYAVLGSLSGNVVVFSLMLLTGTLQGRTLVPNLLYGLATAWSLWQHMAKEGTKLAGVVGCGQFANTVLMCTVGHIIEQNFVRTLYCSQQVIAAEELYAAACALLRSCCEVVVELDNDGVVVGSSTDLNSFLLRGTGPCGPGQNGQGQRLADLIVDEEERQVFLQRLSEPRMKAIGLAENMPVSMKDAIGTSIRLELLWFQYQQLGGRLRYMVGLREYSDAVILQAAPQVSMSMATDDLHGLPETVSVHPDMEDYAVVAAVDTTSPGFPLRSVSAQFTIRVGSLPVGVPFLSHMTQPSVFETWVQDALSASSAGADSSDFHLTFKMPQGRLKAICRVVRDGGGCAKVDPSFVHLLFYNIRHQREGRPRRSVRSSSTLRMSL